MSGPINLKILLMSIQRWQEQPASAIHGQPISAFRGDIGNEFVTLYQNTTNTSVGVDYKVKNIEREGKKYKLSIWDTAGQERFRVLTSSYYRGCHGVFLVYSIDDRSTFDSLQTWFDELETYASEDVVRIIVANKMDKQHSRVVSTEEGQRVAKQKNCLYFETSAKQPAKVTEMFDLLVDEVIATPSLVNPPTPAQKIPGTLNLNAQDQSASSNYCSC